MSFRRKVLRQRGPKAFPELASMGNAGYAGVGGNHVEKLLEAMQGFKKGDVVETNVYHDDWCDRLNERGPCNCDPDVKVVRKDGAE